MRLKALRERGETFACHHLGGVQWSPREGDPGEVIFGTDWARAKSKADDGKRPNS